MTEETKQCVTAMITEAMGCSHYGSLEAKVIALGFINIIRELRHIRQELDLLIVEQGTEKSSTIEGEVNEEMAKKVESKKATTPVKGGKSTPAPKGMGSGKMKRC